MSRCCAGILEYISAPFRWESKFDLAYLTTFAVLFLLFVAGAIYQYGTKQQGVLGDDYVWAVFTLIIPILILFIKLVKSERLRSRRRRERRRNQQHELGLIELPQNPDVGNEVPIQQQEQPIRHMPVVHTLSNESAASETSHLIKSTDESGDCSESSTPKQEVSKQSSLPSTGTMSQDTENSEKALISRSTTSRASKMDPHICSKNPAKLNEQFCCCITENAMQYMMEFMITDYEKNIKGHEFVNKDGIENEFKDCLKDLKAVIHKKTLKEVMKLFHSIEERAKKEAKDKVKVDAIDSAALWIGMMHVHIQNLQTKESREQSSQESAGPPSPEDSIAGPPSLTDSAAEPPSQKDGTTSQTLPESAAGPISPESDGGAAGPISPESNGVAAGPISTESDGGAAGPISTESDGGAEPISSESGGSAAGPLSPESDGGAEPISSESGGSAAGPISPERDGGAEPILSESGGSAAGPISPESDGSAEPISSESGSAAGPISPESDGSAEPISSESGSAAGPISPESDSGARPISSESGGSAAGPISPESDVAAGTISPESGSTPEPMSLESGGGAALLVSPKNDGAAAAKPTSSEDFAVESTLLQERGVEPTSME